LTRSFGDEIWAIHPEGVPPFISNPRVCPGYHSFKEKAAGAAKERKEITGEPPPWKLLTTQGCPWPR